MLAEPLNLDLTNRGFWRGIIYPVCLVQKFKTCHATDIGQFLDESDRFHTNVMNSRINWLDEQRIRYKMYFEVDYVWPEFFSPVIYRLFIEFKSKDAAASYKEEWS